MKKGEYALVSVLSDEYGRYGFVLYAIKIGGKRIQVGVIQKMKMNGIII